jgi:hypothetical protein
VVNKAPLSNILNNPSATGRVSLWGNELSPLDITHEKQKAIKSQVLPDFTAEWLELQNTRRERYSQKMQGLSMFCISTTRTGSRIAADTIILAFCAMGSRYGRKIT